MKIKSEKEIAGVTTIEYESGHIVKKPKIVLKTHEPPVNITGKLDRDLIIMLIENAGMKISGV